MWCIFQEWEGLRNIADNPHTPHHTHRVLFLSAVFQGQARSSPECDVLLRELLFVNIIFISKAYICGCVFVCSSCLYVPLSDCGFVRLYFLLHVQLAREAYHPNIVLTPAPSSGCWMP